MAGFAAAGIPHHRRKSRIMQYLLRALTAVGVLGVASIPGAGTGSAQVVEGSVPFTPYYRDLGDGISQVTEAVGRSVITPRAGVPANVYVGGPLGSGGFGGGFNPGGGVWPVPAAPVGGFGPYTPGVPANVYVGGPFGSGSFGGGFNPSGGVWPVPAAPGGGFGDYHRGYIRPAPASPAATPVMPGGFGIVKDKGMGDDGKYR
jgi:hypothetical protein